MITQDEAYDVIASINEEAHGEVMAYWLAADDADDDDMRVEASNRQSEHFRSLFHELSPDVQQAVHKYAGMDESFAEEFNSWFCGDD